MQQIPIDELQKIANATNTDIHKLLGNFYMQNNDFVNSISNFKTYLEKYPDDAIVLGVLGYLHSVLYVKTLNNSFIETAISYTEKAHLLDKKNPQITANLASMYKDIGKLDKALELWPDILKMDPSDKNYYDYALINLKLGNFEEYYKYANSRLNLNVANHFYPRLGRPLWHGQDISESTLLVHWEQGFGDTLMFSRYLKLLQNKAKRVVFIVQKELEELFKHNDFGCEVYSDISKAGKFDYHIPLASLMEIFNVSAENLIPAEKYLYVDIKTIHKFKKLYFNNDKFKIAIKYKGDSSGPANRNIPTEKITQAFGELENIEVYSLQFEDEYENSNIINLKNKTKNFYETAAIIENMDLVITTDNVILHLAGALGKTTFGLFNKVSECRWFDLSGDNVKWYKNIKPYVSKELNNWDGVIQEAISSLGQI